MGRRSECKPCYASIRKAQYQATPEKYRTAGMEQYRKHKAARRQKNKEWFLANPGYHATYQKKRREDPLYRIKSHLRSRLWEVVKSKNKYKIGSAITAIGCSIDTFKLHMEKQFYPRSDGTQMTWGNYGRNGWHVDHKYPISKVDLSDIEQFSMVSNYMNLQPLWAEDNLIKSSKIILDT